jgi:hypothetical protein
VQLRQHDGHGAGPDHYSGRAGDHLDGRDHDQHPVL